MTLFKKLKKGLTEALEYQEGNEFIAKRVHHKESKKFKPVEVLKPLEIKKLRLSLELSQKEFSNFLGVSYETIAKWEQGYNKPQAVALRLMKIIASHKELMNEISYGK